MPNPSIPPACFAPIAPAAPTSRRADNLESINPGDVKGQKHLLDGIGRS